MIKTILVLRKKRRHENNSSNFLKTSPIMMERTLQYYNSVDADLNEDNGTSIEVKGRSMNENQTTPKSAISSDSL